MSIAQTAKRLIQKNGRPISIRQRILSVTDSAKPWADDGDPAFTDTKAYGVFIDETASDLVARVSAVSRLVLSPVEVNGVQVYIAGSGLTVAPAISMQIVDGDRVLEIKKVGTVWKGAEAVLYICKVEN